MIVDVIEVLQLVIAGVLLIGATRRAPTSWHAWALGGIAATVLCVA